MKRAAALVLCVLLCTVSVYAHPGGLDGNGGHYDRSTGEYHYHHGYPAHQHVDGQCPYVFDDRTGQTSGGSGTAQRTPGNNRYVPKEKPKETISWEDIGACLILALCGVGFLVVVFEPNRRRGRKPSAPASAPVSRQDPLAEKYRALYTGKSIRDLAGVPGWACFDDRNLPHTLICQGEEDPFEVFVTDSGSAYHRRACKFAQGGHPVNLCATVSMGRCACKACEPMGEVPEFVVQYRNLRKIQRKYRIDMRP